VDGDGNVYVADISNHTIRKVTANGTLSTLAGLPDSIGSADGIGNDSRFNTPLGIAVDSTGYLYVSSGDNTIRKGQLAGPPVIVTQPQSQTVATGTSVQFSVSASGTPALTYQWYFNNSPLNGATSSTFGFANAGNFDAGDYTVVVTNSLGSVTSAKATLTISAPPPSNPAATNSGGGAINAWFVASLLAFAGARLLNMKKIRHHRSQLLDVKLIHHPIMAQSAKPSALAVPCNARIQGISSHRNGRP
jgi:hypothetical protein